MTAIPKVSSVTVKQYWLWLIEGNKEIVGANVGNKEIDGLEVGRTVFKGTDEVEGSIDTNSGCDAEGFEDDDGTIDGIWEGLFVGTLDGLDEGFSVGN